MKERPILFSGEMVKAISANSKTQTRRSIKPQPVKGKPWKDWIIDPEIMDLPTAYCPYGIVGDRLWVRETFWQPPEITSYMLRLGADTWPDVLYQADDPDNLELIAWGWKKKPSIHMPKKFARIWLEITGIRIERLHDISYKDVFAEGVQIRNFDLFGDSDHREKVAVAHFKNLWNSINFKKYPWSSNPWVWKVEFAQCRIKTP